MQPENYGQRPLDVAAVLLSLGVQPEPPAGPPLRRLTPAAHRARAAARAERYYTRDPVHQRQRQRALEIRARLAAGSERMEERS
jgi:hypothetical protein